MLSRSDFEEACKAFARRHRQWSWAEGHRAGYGYLTRQTSHVYNQRHTPAPSPETEENMDIELADIATAHSAPPALNVHEFIVYSAPFRVPAFYFTIHDTNGTPLSLNDVVETSLFKLELPSGSEATEFALTVPASTSFPLLSQGEHPTLGTPCWYLHPCNTEAAVGEFVGDAEGRDWSAEERVGRWMEIWAMIVGSVLNI